MASVFDVANFFIDYFVNSDEDSITNLQLNKLLYFSQGHYLARTGNKLFVEQIEAWRFGPVVPSIYSAYKGCGKMPIMTIDENYNPSIFSKEELQLLIDVSREYGKYAPSALVSMTHKIGTPWEKVYIPTKNQPISTNYMINFFSKEENRLKSFQETISSNNIPTVSKLPKSWYDPSEDSVWEAYCD